jgi:CheY-like chemotaxis protein
MMTIVDDKNMGFALGASEYLTKPIDWERLTTILRKYRTPESAEAVLVIEDDPQMRDMLRRNLIREGWRVTEAANGKLGVEQLARHVPSLILLDLMMPEMDGFEFMHQLRQRANCRHVPVIVITAKDLTEHDRQRLNGQVVRIIQKGSASQTDLLAQVRSLLASPREHS